MQFAHLLLEFPDAKHNGRFSRVYHFLQTFSNLQFPDWKVLHLTILIFLFRFSFCTSITVRQLSFKLPYSESIIYMFSIWAFKVFKAPDILFSTAFWEI